MKNIRRVYDIIGIGIGPFNLGLAALCSTIPELQCLFIDQVEGFNWHPGLLLAGARLQVPFYADLVSLADPCNPFIYMAFLKAKGRMFRFGILEEYTLTRNEYNEYCQWVVDQLPSLQFRMRCDNILYDPHEKLYSVITGNQIVLAKHVVLGTGTIPSIPPFARQINHPSVFHSSDYLFRKEDLAGKRVTIIGSGQSAAEIFQDLLNSEGRVGELYWFTRSERFYPMDYSRLSLEMSSPGYIDHFFSLDAGTRKKMLSVQDVLYKGINSSLIHSIYDSLHAGKNKSHLHPNCELKEINKGGMENTSLYEDAGIDTQENNQFRLSFAHLDLRQSFEHTTDAVILATGYRNYIPAFIAGIKDHIRWNENGLYCVKRNYSIDANNSIFVQNAETHTHGFNAADLSLGPYRNSVIVNTILGREHFKIEQSTTYQNFGLPSA